jgi:hypothetical protein
MKKNEGTMDRIVRAVLAIVILYFAFSTLTGFLALLGYVIGIVLLLTAITGFCYLYQVVNINTNKSSQKDTTN